jgi:hypothetical protein
MELNNGRIRNDSFNESKKGSDRTGKDLMV